MNNMINEIIYNTFKQWSFSDLIAIKKKIAKRLSIAIIMTYCKLMFCIELIYLKRASRCVDLCALSRKARTVNIYNFYRKPYHQ